MMTAMLTAKNILTGERKIDVWAVNRDTFALRSPDE